MKILALEFSSEQRSVAIIVDGELRARALETGVKECRPIGMLDAALRDSKLEREEIDCLAIGLGPGSHTGIRSAIALAQGWQLARGTRTVGIRSFECLAAQAQAGEIYGMVTVVVDAQRNEFYLAGYEVGPSGFSEVLPPTLAGMEELVVRARTGEIFIGPGITKMPATGRVMFPDAEILGCMAARCGVFGSAENLEPVYLREHRYVKAPPPRVIPGILQSTATDPSGDLKG